MRVFVALSGGVDSSVAAYLLKKQGFDVVGVYYKTYKPTGDKSLCKANGKSAELVAKQLNIPFKVWDLEKEYKEKVFDYLIESYKKGETPNPDIICNREIKFGVFFKRALKEGAEKIATGHWASISNFYPFPVSIFKKELTLKEAKNKSKDQSYFLSQIKKDVLKNAIFPAGNFKSKDALRVFAKKAGLHTYNRKDSQGMCFIGEKTDTKEFLKMFIPPKEGVVKTLSGEELGVHDGVFYYTVGERAKFNIYRHKQNPNQPKLFVLEKNISQNLLVVGTKEELEKRNKSSKKIRLSNVNVFLEKEGEFLARIRHRGEKSKVLLKKENGNYFVYPKEVLSDPAVGQFMALYKKDKVVLSGKMQEIYF